jgi:hypothetical protein
MVTFGHNLMSEEHGLAALIRNGRKAEAASFVFAAICDHVAGESCRTHSSVRREQFSP